MSAHTKEPLRLDAYYYSFAFTGVRSIDRVLAAVAAAGKAYHHTESWTEECESYRPEITGKSCEEWIQLAANAAADERQELMGALKHLVALFGDSFTEADVVEAEDDYESEDEFNLVLAQVRAIEATRLLIAKAEGRA